MSKKADDSKKDEVKQPAGATTPEVPAAPAAAVEDTGPIGKVDTPIDAPTEEDPRVRKLAIKMAFEAKYGDGTGTGDKKPLPTTVAYSELRKDFKTPDPELLYYQYHYVPAGLYDHTRDFTLTMPDDEWQLVVPETFPAKVYYVVGMTIGEEEATRIKDDYLNRRAPKSGRPPSDPKEIERRKAEEIRLMELLPGAIQRAPRYATATTTAAASSATQAAANKGKVPPDDSSSSKAVTVGTSVEDFNKAVEARANELQRAKEEADKLKNKGEGETEETAEYNRAKEKGIGYRNDRFPLAAHLMTRLAGQTIAEHEIAIVAVGLVLSDTGRNSNNVDKGFYDLLQSMASHPHDFAMMINTKLQKMYETLDPTIQAKMDVMEMHVENWREYALVLQFDNDKQTKAQNRTIEGLVTRLDIAERFLPDYIRPQYQSALIMVDAHQIEAAEMQAEKAAVVNDAVTAAAAANATTGRNGGPYPGGRDPPPRRDPWQKVYDLKGQEAKLKKILGPNTSLPMDKDVRHFVESGGEQTPAVREKFFKFLQDHPEYAKQAGDMMNRFQRDSSNNNNNDGSSSSGGGTGQDVGGHN